MTRNYFPKELSERIIKQADIVEIISEFVNLNKKGNNYVGLCPFHEDSSPSFTVSPQKQIFKCFPCGASGNVVTFLQRYKTLTFIQTLEYLAQKEGVEYDFSQYHQSSFSRFNQDELKVLEALEIANSFYKTQIWANQEANDYLAQRGLDTAEIRDKFDIGFAPKGKIKEYLNSLELDNNTMIQAGLLNQDLNEMFWDRVTFGIKDEDGHLVAFSARTLKKDTHSKYINSPETN